MDYSELTIDDIEYKIEELNYLKGKMMYGDNYVSEGFIQKTKERVGGLAKRIMAFLRKLAEKLRLVKPRPAAPEEKTAVAKVSAAMSKVWSVVGPILKGAGGVAAAGAAVAAVGTAVAAAKAAMDTQEYKSAAGTDAAVVLAKNFGSQFNAVNSAISQGASNAGESSGGNMVVNKVISILFRLAVPVLASVKLSGSEIRNAAADMTQKNALTKQQPVLSES